MGGRKGEVCEGEVCEDVWGCGRMRYKEICISLGVCICVVLCVCVSCGRSGRHTCVFGGYTCICLHGVIHGCVCVVH